MKPVTIVALLAAVLSAAKVERSSESDSRYYLPRDFARAKDFAWEVDEGGQRIDPHQHPEKYQAYIKRRKEHLATIEHLKKTAMDEYIMELSPWEVTRRDMDMERLTSPGPGLLDRQIHACKGKLAEVDRLYSPLGRSYHALHQRIKGYMGHLEKLKSLDSEAQLKTKNISLALSYLRELVSDHAKHSLVRRLRSYEDGVPLARTLAAAMTDKESADYAYVEKALNTLEELMAFGASFMGFMRTGQQDLEGLEKCRGHLREMEERLGRARLLDDFKERVKEALGWIKTQSGLVEDNYAKKRPFQAVKVVQTARV